MICVKDVIIIRNCVMDKGDAVTTFAIVETDNH